MKYKIDLADDAKHELKKMDKGVALYLMDVIDDRLSEHPERGLPLQYDLKGFFKLVTRSYRIIYKYNADTVTIYSVGDRKNVYGGH